MLILMHRARRSVSIRSRTWTLLYRSDLLCSTQGDRLEEDWKPSEDDAKGEEERTEETRKAVAKSNAVVLEMLGDLPEADAKPPPNMIFVCKLNPVTTEEVCPDTSCLVCSSMSIACIIGK